MRKLENMSTGGLVPTLEQIASDALTQISYKYWFQVDDEHPLSPFDAKLVDDIYQNELVGSK